jgi:hypothetical protein
MTTTSTHSRHRRVDQEGMHFDAHELHVAGVSVAHIIPDDRDPHTTVYLHDVTSIHTDRFGWTVRTPRGSTRIHLIGTPWPAPDPHASIEATGDTTMTTKLTDTQFVGLMRYTMGTDPHPTDFVVTSGADAIVRRLLDDEAKARGFASWFVAFHEFEAAAPKENDTPRESLARQDAHYRTHDRTIEATS